MWAALARLVLRGSTWSLNRFYEVSRVGPPIPDGPVLVVANHPNSLVDALVVLKVAGRRVRPLARAPLFERPLAGPVLRGLGALPVYRRQDDSTETWRNERTFEAAIAALDEGGAVLIFPEGLSHSEPRLARMKTGAARIALRAEAAAGWRLGLQVVPVGLTYERKHALGGRVAAAVGRPFRLERWRQDWARDDRATVESLTRAIREALERVTLNVPTHADRRLVEAAEALYVTEKRHAAPRDREPLAPRVPRLRRFADALVWLRSADPARFRKLAESVRSYRRRLDLLGVGSGELPRRFPARAVLRYTVTRGVVLLIGLPLAVLGTVAWYLPYQSPRVSLSLYRPAYEVVATVKLVTALLAFPVTFVAWLTVGWSLGGLPALLALGIGLPLAGLAALGWRDRWDAVREDARLFWRAARRHDLREQLVQRRKALVREFDAVRREWMRSRSGVSGERCAVRQYVGESVRRGEPSDRP